MPSPIDEILLVVNRIEARVISLQSDVTTMAARLETVNDKVDELLMRTEFDDTATIQAVYDVDAKVQTILDNECAVLV